ncbi:MAG: pyridoxal phosphate-dependent aminotransferase [Patescibacteria group bacterium]|nr:pyridoxal phosphate-dependent aminotransferase [Patescibacteria group bacterium]
MTEYKFADRDTNVPVSGIGAMMNYGAKYADVLSLGQGTPIFPTPQFIYDYVHERAKSDPSVGMYSSPKIENGLKELIIKEMEQLYGFKPMLDNLTLTTGGIGALYSAMMALVQKGDEVIYFDPSYPLHLSQIHLTEAKPVFVSYKEESGWALDLERLKNSVTKNTKAIILTNPNNPTGTVLSKEEVEEIAKIILENNLILILDEAYDFLTYGKELYSPMKMQEIRNNVILCKSFSKEFAMTGWRIGYAYANPEIIKKLNDVHTYFSISPATPSIVAAIAALSNPRGLEAKAGFIKEFRESRETICQRLDRLPKLFSYQKPAGAYYVFPKYLNFDLTALEFARHLVDEVRVITIPGTAMGPAGVNHLRMSFAAKSDYINRCFDRLDQFAKIHNLN